MKRSNFYIIKRRKMKHTTQSKQYSLCALVAYCISAVLGRHAQDKVSPPSINMCDVLLVKLERCSMIDVEDS